jgi:hypothetical protein
MGQGKRIVDPEFYPCGHPRSEENTVVRSNVRQANRKYCRTCDKAQGIKWRKENPEAVRAIKRRMEAKRKAAGKPSKQQKWSQEQRDRWNAYQREYKKRKRAEAAALASVSKD